MDKRKKPSLWGALSAVIIVAGLLVWWITSLANRDLLWFLRVFRAQADWITVYWDGETTMLFPGDPGYERIMDAFAVGVAKWAGYEGGVGLSDETLTRYRDEWRIVEFHYNDPVQVHTRHLFPSARNFFVPLSGTHANWRRVFAGLTDKPRIGVLNMQEEYFADLQEVVTQVVGD